MIRRAKNGDINGINKLLRQVLEVHHKGRPDLFKGGVTKYTNAQLEDIIADDSRPIFVKTDDNDRIMGYAFCIVRQNKGSNILTDIKTLYIDDLCVDEELRGKHIGKSLYEYVINYARENGFYNVTLNVWTCNENAMKFYNACGMRQRVIGMETIL